MPNGMGKYVYTNGDMYEGPFKNGIQHGIGRYFTKSGSIIEA